MSSDNVFERLFKQWASVAKLVLDAKRKPEDVSRVLQAIIEGRQMVEAVLTLPALLADWARFYWEVFEVDLSFSEDIVPERKQGFDRLLVIAQGMTPQRLFDKCQQLFPSWKYTDSNLDKIVRSIRASQNNHYAVWVRDRVEADEENKNLSAEQLAQQNILGETFEERMIHELKFFKETGKHLDVANITLCTGSRSSSGPVPGVGWRSDGLRVHWCRPRFADSFLRARSAVSLSAEVAKRLAQT